VKKFKEDNSKKIIQKNLLAKVGFDTAGTGLQRV
jgi:hypothetical protein